MTDFTNRIMEGTLLQVENSGALMRFMSTPPGNPVYFTKERMAESYFWDRSCPECICGSGKKKSDKLKLGGRIDSRICACNESPMVGFSDKDNRPFLHCPTQKCKYFRWAETIVDPPFYNLAHTQVEWKPLDGPLYKPRPPINADWSEYIVQGSLGDCWFLSALSVIANSPNHINRILKDSEKEGTHAFVFCIDGIWTRYEVNSLVPVYCQGKRTGECAFARPKDKIAFGPLIEKAYARAYGSYSALHGGQIAEALFDMTGCPVETVKLAQTHIDELWAKIISWHSQNFIICCSTGSILEDVVESAGLVSMHAYSVVDCLELFDVPVGKQLKLDDMFCTGSSFQRQRENVRLIQVRNPWGRKEWKGDWGAQSDKWSRKIREQVPDFREKNCHGKFWISIDDFVHAFDEIDVAKGSSDWFDLVWKIRAEECLSLRDALSGSSNPTYRWTLRSPLKACWCYISIVQPSRRSRRRDYSHTVVWLINACTRRVHASSLGQSADRVVTVETILDENVEYELILVSLDGKPCDAVVRVHSAMELVGELEVSSSSNPFLTCFEFERVVAENLPIQEVVHVACGITITVQKSGGLTAWILEVVEGVQLSVKVHVKLKQGVTNTFGRWVHEISRDRSGYKTVLGIHVGGVEIDQWLLELEPLDYGLSSDVIELE